MRLFIAEKPELARAIAEGLDGNSKNENGFIQKGDNIITWAFGHLLESYLPEDYDEKYKSWSFENLPIVIEEFKYKPIENSEKQLKTIIRLINDTRVKEIVHCGDADDEGQILIDEILEYAKCNKPVLRCLINDITPSAVRNEIAKMKSNTEFKGMSERGFARAQADWLVGLNLTRAYTTAYRKQGGSETLSVGRVMTPILGLIVARDFENDTFTSRDYFLPCGVFMNENNLKLVANLKAEEKIYEESIAKDIQTKCENQKCVLNLKKQSKKEYPPLPYNLLVLQTEASKLYGYSPNKTLEITQKLREEYKAITYNRSDCQYLPETIYAQSPQIIEALRANFNTEIGQSNANLNIKSKAFDDGKLSAHYAIIPTQNKFNIKDLNEEQLNIYTLICQRFLMQFYEAREYDNYTLDFAVKEYTFSTSFNKTTFLGFKDFFSCQDSSDEEANFDINLLKNLDTFLLSSIEIKRLKTKPRPRYTMTTLLKDLNSVAKYVKNEKIKKLLIEKDKDKKGESGGIGTPATRSEMIEKLIKQGYINVSSDKKQNIQSTQKGKELIKCVTPLLTTPDMTALWFEYQKAIQNKETTRQDFLKSIIKTINTEIEKIKAGGFAMRIAKVQCPKCKKGFLRRMKSKNSKKYFWGCSEYASGCRAIYEDKNGKAQVK